MQVWAINGLGGYSAAASIDAELRQRATSTTFFHQMAMGVSSYGKHRSDRILIDKLGRVATPMSTTGMGESDNFPTTTAPIVQTQVVATEYGNAIEWTEKLETFAQWGIGQMMAMALRQDQIEGLDRVAYNAYALGKVIYTPTTASQGLISTTGTAAAVAGSAATVAHAKDTSDYMRTNKVPPMAGGDYFAICHTDAVRGIKDSTEFIQVAAYHAPEKLFDSEVGKYASIRWVEENNVLVSPAGTNLAGFAQAVVFGSDNVIEAVAVAPHLRFKVPQEYGRDRGEAHYYVGGLAQVWQFGTDGGEEHQVRWDSQ